MSPRWWVPTSEPAGPEGSPEYMPSLTEAPVRRLPAALPVPEPGGDLWRRREPRTIRVFDRDPALLEGLQDAVAGQLRRRVSVPRMTLVEGPWPAAGLREPEPGALGLLVVDGLLVRSVRMGTGECLELIGAGDLVRPWDQEAELPSMEHDTSWWVLRPATVAVLDRRVGELVGRYPELVNALLSRSLRRSRTNALSLAISHVRGSENRLLALLWHLADRWGRVTPDGVVVPLPLTHELIAHLSCMRRPTASTALQQLSRSGRLVRLPDRTWMLPGLPPGRGPAAMRSPV